MMQLLIKNSILMSFVILLFLLLRKLFFKRYSATWRYYTWLPVILGLLIPFRPAFDLFPASIKPPVQLMIPAPPPAAKAQPEPESIHKNTEEPLPNLPAEPEPAITGKVVFHWTTLVNTVWAAGFLLFLLYCLIKHRKFIKAVRRWSYDENGAAISGLLNEARLEAGIHKNVEVKICKIVSTPMLTGFRKPVILLPSCHFEPDELELILRHELTHYRRKDLWYKALLLLANAMHWFNPFVFFMVRAATADCEISCDEAVLKDKDRKQRMLYGETILRLMEQHSDVSTLFSTSFKGGIKVMEKRMDSIMDSTKKKAGIFMLCVVMACTVLTGMASPEAAQNQLKSPAVNADTDMETVTIRNKTWYIIDTEAQLTSIGSEKYPLSGNYILNADITLTKDWIPIGTYDAPFTGSFIGNGYEIIDLTIKDPEIQYIGMFAFVYNANIGNVILRNPDIESAFQKGDSISPFVVFGWGNSNIYDNKIINDNSHSSRTESLSESFEKYKDYHVIYDADQDAVFYNGKRVKLFVEFKTEKADSFSYAFDLCYRDSNTDSTLYLEAVKDKNGKVTGIRLLNKEIARDLLEEMEEARPQMSSGQEQAIDLENRGETDGNKTSSYKEDLSKSFEPYSACQVIYNKAQNAVYYNGKRVKLFVDFGTAYAFDFYFQDGNTDSTLYLEAVKDKNGKVTGIGLLDEEIARNLLEGHMSSDYQKKPSVPEQSYHYLTLNGTSILEQYGITATDNGITKDKVPNDIKTWLSQCDKKQGAYTLTNKTTDGYTTYVYYNGGGHYPYRITADDGSIGIYWYSQSTLASDGDYSLMCLKAPKEYKNIALYLDDVFLENRTD